MLIMLNEWRFCFWIYSFSFWHYGPSQPFAFVSLCRKYEKVTKSTIPACWLFVLFLHLCRVCGGCWDRWEAWWAPTHTDPHYPESRGRDVTLTLQQQPRGSSTEENGREIEQEGGGEGGGVGGEQVGGWGGGGVGGHHLLQPPRLAGSNHGDTTLCHWHNRFFNRGKTITLQSIFSVCSSPQIYVISFFGDYWTKKHIFDRLFKGSEHLTLKPSKNTVFS